MAEKLIFEKIVDKSALTDGITIPMAYHETLYSHLSRRLQHGESMPIQIIMNGTSYTVQLKNLAFDTQRFNRHDILQIRYSRNSPIASALRTVFSQTNERVEQHAAIGTSRERIIIPAKEQVDWYGKVIVGCDRICIELRGEFYAKQQQQVLTGDEGADGAAHSGNGEVGDQHGGRARDRCKHRMPVGA